MTGILDGWGRIWAEYFAAAVVQNTIFLCFLFLILYALKNRSARLRYVVALAGLAKLLLPPFVPSGLLTASPAESLIFTVDAFGGLSIPQSSPSGIPTGVPAQLSLYAALFVSWAAFAAAYLLSALYSTVRLRRTLRGAAELPVPSVADGPGSSRVRLFRSEKIAVPLTIGVFSSRIYVPAAWDSWSDRCRETVLRHETAHICRNDGFFQGLQIVALAVYFFHPMVWLLNRRLGDYREMACDDAAVAGAQHARVEYSRTLVEIAETIARENGFFETASALVRRRKELTDRVEYQIKEGVMRSISRGKSVVLAALIGLLTVAFSWYPGDYPSAEVTTSVADSPAAGNTVRVSIKGARDVTVEASKVMLDDFENAMSKAAERMGEDLVVDLRCDENTPMSTLLTVHEALKKMNILKVRYQSDLGKALPLLLPSKRMEEMAKDLDKTDLLNLVITGSGGVKTGGKTVPVERIGQLVETGLAENEHLVVCICFEEGAKYGDFVRTLDQAKTGGAPRIMIGGSGH